MKIKSAFFVLIFVGINLVFGCATQNPNVKEATAWATPQRPLPYIIQPGDELDIKFFYNPELNETVAVRPDGKISLQLIDEIQAASLQPSELDRTLTNLYSEELKKPVITVIVRSFTGQRVYVGGEVNIPGLITLPPGITPLQAIFQSGGFKETAQPAETLIIRKGSDNKPVPLRIDLAAVMNANGHGEEIQLQADDIVYVPKSTIAKLNKFVNQYIEQLLLYRGVSLGFSYQVHRDK
jgi:protein involved in polysaccharide export with SLBB domain